MISTIAYLTRRVERAWAEGRSDAELHFEGYRAWRERLTGLGVANVQELRVLDIGCGDRAPLALLFAAEGARVTALDTLPVALGLRRPRMWLALALHASPRSAMRQVMRDLVHTGRYWYTLGRLNGRRLPHGRVHLVRGDAAQLPFSDATFDLVVSSAVWEHLPDVERATREVGRVLSPDGLAVIQVALFPALQGGHHAEWHSVGPAVRRTIRPWDHLRDDHVPYPVYLNEWRESDYRSVFERALSVVAWSDDELRGVSYLSPALTEELASYTERDLLLSGITIWARPPSPIER